MTTCMTWYQLHGDLSQPNELSSKLPQGMEMFSIHMITMLHIELHIPYATLLHNTITF